MLSYEESLKLVLEQTVQPMPVEYVDIDDAAYRVAACDIVSPISNPAFNNAAMDGFAISVSEATRGTSSIAHPMEFVSEGIITAGMASIDARPLAENEHELPTACEIMTGAIVPENFNAVVRIEDVEVSRDAVGRATRIKLKRQVSPLENIRMRGDDFFENTTLIKEGTVLEPQHLMAAAACGIRTLSVKKIPTLSCFCTGDELIRPSCQEPAKLPAGKIFSSNDTFLKNVFGKLASVSFHQDASDDPKALVTAFRSILDTAPDIVITTGAVSMGTKDFVPTALKEIEASIIFHKVAIRPAKPMLMAVKDLPAGKRSVFFCLPGNPISAVVACRFFVLPYLFALLGIPAEIPIKARLASPLKKPENLRCFYFGSFAEDANLRREIRVSPSQKSFMLLPFLKSNAWVILNEQRSNLEQGEEVDCLPLYPRWSSIIQ
ncbi:MAG: molybdopterin molybdotransferase MoeA [Deltaproteobacteria bacterium]|nr:molybdopterin molybdotransferase MoeA [Deltaproteobacteria bacterium]